MAEFEYDGRDLEITSFAVRYHEWIAEVFRPYLGSRMAEVGAGTGSFTKILKRQPFTELVAVEPSRILFDRLTAAVRDDSRIVPCHGFFKDVAHAYPAHFDSIIYVNVLEHVENDFAELAEIYKALAPGGYLLLFVPALAWLYSTHDKTIGHFRRYYKRALVEQVKNAGFSLVFARYFDIAGIIPWLVIFKWLKLRPGGGAISLYDRVVVPVEKVIEGVIPPPVGKNVILVARKPQIRESDN